MRASSCALSSRAAGGQHSCRQVNGVERGRCCSGKLAAHAVGAAQGLQPHSRWRLLQRGCVGSVCIKVTVLGAAHHTLHFRPENSLSPSSALTAEREPACATRACRRPSCSPRLTSHSPCQAALSEGLRLQPHFTGEPARMAAWKAFLSSQAQHGNSQSLCQAALPESLHVRQHASTHLR